ncbi:MAG TPA: hypothetical protein VL462_00155 [Candidatus Nitrosotalea sp.]|jgi:hypothetical protein|nr:hypothetical protein [Candidatus Nitrosotalea sp.]
MIAAGIAPHDTTRWEKKRNPQEKVPLQSKKLFTNLINGCESRRCH